ncbi:MAG: ribose-phosphate diphosphokinase [Alphaproteobacteria bacterium]|nr:ribose-phosphate diphosphokinase [Alphaproteobacteria bacterium]
MKPIIFDFPHVSLLGNNIRKAIAGEEGKILLRNFPDGETYLRISTNVQSREVIINASLFYPNDWILSLLFLADALQAQGARHVGLLAPYLSYMRQDKIFQPGEALTSKTFANLLSRHFNYLITVDPHLHRYHELGEIYSIPSTVVKAAPLLSQWISTNIENPFLIGPDNESRQWVQEIAKDSPYIILDKIRHKDGQVQITWPTINNIENMTPVLVDDIISSGVTILQAIQHLKTLCAKAPVCVAIHPIFAENAYQKLLDAGVSKIVTSNSISHPSNQIDLSPLLVSSLEKTLNKI